MLTPYPEIYSAGILDSVTTDTANNQHQSETPHHNHAQTSLAPSTTTSKATTGTSLASLAATSRAWQAHIEPLTFRSLNLSQHDLADAARIITPARRRPLVRSLTFNIQLDFYDDDDEHDAHRRVVSTSSAATASDVDRLAPEEAERVVRRLRPVSPLRRYERSVIRFLREGDEVDHLLPEFEDVGELSIQQFGYRGRELPSMIVTRCTKLSKLNLSLMDWPRGDVEERKRRRRALDAVIDDLPMRLREMTFTYFGSPPRDQNCDPPNLLDPGETEDVLSLSLRRFYRRWSTRRLVVGSTILGQDFF
ncbi:hypothetical protein N658DRAFT_482647 [Parathielavia hyrcaniae]|uniref:Uncharacterized protein n=1 Tax=Parathielavia hyrcaniae TaxID=113614 RepID=A0AAN6QB06_9PEZI|nr:hypothetical protein N658DRAFT_482647 [Parathielavia hyrcaniae]